MEDHKTAFFQYHLYLCYPERTTSAHISALTNTVPLPGCESPLPDAVQRQQSGARHPSPGRGGWGKGCELIHIGQATAIDPGDLWFPATFSACFIDECIKNNRSWLLKLPAELCAALSPARRRVSTIRSCSGAACIHYQCPCAQMSLVCTVAFSTKAISGEEKMING